jgi:hypothetical protein
VIDAVILDAALAPSAVFPLITELEHRVIPFIFSVPPTRYGHSTGGFVLSERDSDLLKIGDSLFPPPAKHQPNPH